MEDTVRWTVTVSKETDIALRTFLAQQGFKKGDLSKFIEEVVNWRVFDRLVADVKANHRDVSLETLQAEIDEACAAVRPDLFPSQR